MKARRRQKADLILDWHKQTLEEPKWEDEMDMYRVRIVASARLAFGLLRSPSPPYSRSSRLPDLRRRTRLPHLSAVRVISQPGQSSFLADRSCSLAFRRSVKASSFAPDAKLILLTSEGGSITLRTQKEGGGMFGHHGSKAAGNMVSSICEGRFRGTQADLMMACGRSVDCSASTSRRRASRSG